MIESSTCAACSCLYLSRGLLASQLYRLALAVAQQESILPGALASVLECLHPDSPAQPAPMAAQLRLICRTVSALATDDGWPAGAPAAVQGAAHACNAVLQQLPAWLQALAGTDDVPPADAALGSPPSEEWVDAAFAALADLHCVAAAVDLASLVPGGASVQQQQQLDADRALGTLRCANLLCCNLEGSSEKQLHRRGCSRCRAVSYCCAACQQQDWPRHCAVCKALASQTTSP